jgi:TP901 family phage tail tape measure protein
MPLGSRELLLIIRGQDELSRVLRGIGLSMTDLDAKSKATALQQMTLGAAVSTVGVGMAAVGAVGLKWLAGSINQAAQFNSQVALVKTQVDGVSASQQQLANVTKNVASQIAAPIDQLNASLYDIWSSMDVNVPQSQQLLTEFAKAAVAGQVDVQTAGRATISILNAWKLPISDVTNIEDVQFQLVRKGVGTYQEFASAIGQAIPSAQRAGQSFQTLAGMMAYLTRNGLSTSMAAASAQRALDAFSNPKVVAGLQQMGVAVLNSKGEYNDFGTVIEQLQQKLAGLTEPQRVAAITGLFKGAGGTIQAMRFYDTVLQSTGSVQQFLGLVGDMNNASGALNQAYGTMADTMSSKTQVLKNNYQLLQIQVGDALTPVLSKLVSVATDLLKWWNSLGSGTQKLIIYITAGTFAFLTIAGVVIALVGIFMMMSAAATLLGFSMMSVVLPILSIIAAIGLLVLSGYEIVTHWTMIKQFWGGVWTDMKDFFQVTIATITGNWNAFTSVVGENWHNFTNSVGLAWNTVWGGIKAGFNDTVTWITTKIGQLVAGAKSIWNELGDIFAAPINFLINVIWNFGLKWVWNTLMGLIGQKQAMLQDIPTIPRFTGFAGGGPVSGPGGTTGDKILAMLSDKEFVVKASEAQKHLGLLQMINSGMLPAFALGGQVAADANVGKVLSFVSAPGPISNVVGNPYGATTSNSSYGDWTRAGAFGALSTVNNAADWLAQKLATYLSSIGNAITSPFTSGPGSHPMSGSQAQMIGYAATLFGKYGWGQDQLQPLVNLWNKESGWNPNAVNPSSGAYGIPQALGHGHPYNLGDWQAQIQWGEDYVHGRYGNPAAAWAHEMAFNWYDNGNFIPRGLSLMANGTGGNEHLAVLTTTQWNILDNLANNSARAGVASAGTGNTYHITVEGINIYTNEIDPEQHGRELGDYLVRFGGGGQMS